MHTIRSLACSLLMLCMLAGVARADRRYFVQSYTPYLASAGSLELEATAIAAYGQGDRSATAWQNRFEFEYGVTDRLTGALYFNYIQSSAPEATSRFDGPSLEFIYRLSDPGKLPVDPAAYLEVRENGDELEVEPKLLLARRIYKLVGVLNVAGEFEHHFAGEERGLTQKNLRVTGGFSREIGHVAAIAIEAVYDKPALGTGSNASALVVGPTLNLQTARAQIALGWQPQVSGHPATGGGINLAGFPRGEVRLIVGVDL